MVPEGITSLILDEYARRGTQFIENVDLDQYLEKLASRAEFVSDSLGGRCRGFVAYYCNDLESRQAFITLVLVDPQSRGSGLGRALVAFVLDVARRRGFTTCRLEVSMRNPVAYNMYLSQGFRPVEERAGKYLMEIAL